MFSKISSFFRVKERGSTVKTEVLAGITTFIAMAYILFANSHILGVTGMDQTAVLVGTAIAAGIGTLLTAFLANAPLAQASGMGLNAYFTFSIVQGMGYTWEQALAMVFISGLLFLAITLSPLRKKVIEMIPASLKNAISVGIGLFITLIGLLNSGIVSANDNLLSLNLAGGPQLITIIGLFVTFALLLLKVKGAILLGIVTSTIVALFTGVTSLPASIALSDISLAPIFMKMDFNLLTLGVLPLLTAIFSLALVDMFDTIGTLVGTASKVGMVDGKGNLVDGDSDKVLLADAIATCAGACVGVSTVTTYVESIAGIEQGGRTGLTNVVVGLLFFLSVLLAPIAGIVPASATAPALIIVGILMMSNIGKIDWADPEVAIPAFLTIVMMPFAYSISDGIGIGFIAYVFVKLIMRKAKDIHWLLWIVSVLFLVKYLLPLF